MSITGRAGPEVSVVSDVAWDREGSVSPIGWPGGIIQENDVLDAESLPKVQMPNRNKLTLPPLAQWKPGMPRPSPFRIDL